MRSMAFWKANIRRVRAGMIALALVCVCLFGILPPARAESDGMIRVKLTRLGAPEAITLSVDCDYYLASAPDVRLSSGDSVTFAAAEDGIRMKLNGQTYALDSTVKLMRAQSGNRGIRFEQPDLSGRFCGDLGLSASGGALTAILNIYVENYLYGVVGYAMPPSSGIEALKAQAVAARTYALRRKAGRGDSVYDLTDAATDQVFKGYSNTSDYDNVVRAVDETKGWTLFYGSTLAQCYFCTSNGGQTESARNAFGSALDYSVVQDDPYDLNSAAPVRTAVINKDLSGIKEELKDALRQRMNASLAASGMDADAVGIKVTGLESVTACDSRFAAPSRLYKSLTFKLSVVGNDAAGQRRSGTATISLPTYGAFEDWYDLSLNDEDNETVWVKETDSAFEITFRRVGSGVGLSQRGAQAMAQQGKRAQDILAFYYPGTEGRQLTLTDATRDARTVEPDAALRVVATARLSDRTDLLNAPGDEGVATATIAAGAALEVYGVQGDWAAVGSSGKYGYVRTDALESFALQGVTVTRAGEATLGSMRKSADVLQLPVSGAKVVGRAEKGGEVQVYAWTDDWVMLRAAGDVKGFVPMETVSFSAPEAAAAPTPDPDAFTDAGDVEARVKRDATLFEGPGELSRALDTLKAGMSVRVRATSREWARVKTAAGVEGYVKPEVLQAAAASGIDGGAVHKVKGKKFMYVTADMTAMYESYSAESAVLTTLCYGERVRLGAYNDLWACVRTGGVTGFVPMEVLSERKPADPEGGAFSRPKAETTALTTRDKAEILNGLSADARTVAKLDKGRRVRVAAFNKAFALVSTEDGVGYMRLGDLAVESLTGSVTRQSCDARVTANMKVYGAAGEKGGLLGRVSKGDVVRVIAWNDTFAAIEFQGGTGYVRLKHLERIE